MGLPIGDDLDADHVEPLEFAPGEHADHGSADSWLRTTGRYDPDEGRYFVDIAALGGTERPTELGLMAFHEWETDPAPGSFDRLITDTFPRIESDTDRADWLIHREDDPDVAARSGVSLLAHDHTREPTVSLLSNNVVQFADYDISFSIEWKASGSPDQELVSDLETALLEAIPVYRDLMWKPLPKLKTTWSSKGDPGGKEFQYFIHDAENNWVKTLGTGFHNSGCGGNAAGKYLIPGQYALTCYEANSPERTTKHELFHAIQAHWTRTGRDTWVNEGTARLADDLVFENPRPPYRAIDIGLEVAQDLDEEEEITPEMSAPYQTSVFWLQLLKDTGDTDFWRLGHLFGIGRNTDAAREFVEDHTPYSSLEAAHWRWVRNAAFEGEDLGETYQWFECDTHKYALRDDIEVEDEIDGLASKHVAVFDVDIDADVASPGSPPPATVGKDLEPIPELAGDMVKLELPGLDENHFFRLTFDGDTPREARLYPPGDHCEPEDPEWDHRTYNDLDDGMLVVNRGTAPTSDATLVMQGPLGSSRLLVEGPYRYTDMELVSPTWATNHTYDQNLFVTLETTIVDPGDEIADVEVTFELNDIPITPVSTSWDPPSISAEDERNEYELPHSELCAASDHEDSSFDRIDVTLSTLDEDGEPIASEWELIGLSVDYPELVMGYTAEVTEVWSMGHQLYNPSMDSPAWWVGSHMTTDVLEFEGWARICDEHGDDVSDGLHWYEDRDPWNPYAESPVLTIDFPEDLEDEDGNPIDRLFFLEHEDFSGELPVLIESCEPYCMDPEQIDDEIIEEYLNPLIACQDRTLDPDCTVPDLAAFETGLDRAITDELFDLQDPATSFPLQDFDHWDDETGAGGMSQALAADIQDIIAASFDGDPGGLAGHTLADSERGGEFVRFVYEMKRSFREWAEEYPTEIGRLGRTVVWALGVGAYLFGDPRVGGWNAWRFVGEAADVENPGRFHEAVDMAAVVESGLLGAGAAVETYGTNPTVLDEKIRLGTIYGMLVGVLLEARDVTGE